MVKPASHTYCVQNRLHTQKSRPLFAGFTYIYPNFTSFQYLLLRPGHEPARVELGGQLQLQSRAGRVSSNSRAELGRELEPAPAPKLGKQAPKLGELTPNLGELAPKFGELVIYFQYNMMEMSILI